MKRVLAEALLPGLLSASLLGACSPTATPTISPRSPGPAASAAAIETPAAGQSATPAPSPGLFAFDPESITGYYATLGYTCGDPHPSSQAAGYLFRSCTLLDPDGRTRAIGIVTDANDDVADAYASLRAAASETVLDPTVALDPFAAFLGAMLGETQGESLLPWLAGHLGDTDAKEAVGDLTIATYAQSTDDHSKLYVEIATSAFLSAPPPKLAPTASP